MTIKRKEKKMKDNININVLKCCDCGSRKIKLTDHKDIVDCVNCGQVNPIYIGFNSLKEQQRKEERDEKI